MRYLLPIILLFPMFAYAQDNNTVQITLGAFWSSSDSGLNFTGPARNSYNVDFESDLNLSEREVLPSVEIRYKFYDRHNFYLSWRELHRQSTYTYVSKPFEFSFDDELHTIQGGARVTTTFNVDIARLGYGYSFYQNNNWDVIGSFGVHLMFFELGLSGDVALCLDKECDPDTYLSSSGSTFESVTAPLPDFGLTTVYNINDNWSIRAQAQYFYLSIGEYSGELIDFSIAADYKITDSFSAVLSYEYYEINASVEDTLGELDIYYGFHGPMFAIAYSF